jgi:DNA-binding XRE family transcriptional regulator/desulfoferrodoxin (superoxide reductase-like protein)
MDSIKIGKMIAKIRKDKNLTQRELAEKLNVSDKAISKWERGSGLPDIASINSLAEILEINVNEILSGDTMDNDNDMGNMKKTKFFVCLKCGNIITSTNDLILNCCGKKLTELKASYDNNDKHVPGIEHIEDDLFIHIDHEMEKRHFISFIAYVTCDKLMLCKLYPEQNAEIRFKMSGHGILYVFCIQHGLFAKRI